MRSAARQSIFVLAPLCAPRRSGLAILFLTDGNQRAETTAGGYRSGARNVIALAEHLAARPDVAVMIACILSPNNVQKRGQAFFAKVREEFVRLRCAIETAGVLVDAGIRLEICGDLSGLVARGEEAALLAAEIEATVAATARVSEPRLRLLFGVGYDNRTPVDLGVDIVVRTGMEEGGVLRLSGLSTSPRILNVAFTKLWPELSPGEVDSIVEAAKRRSDPVLAEGYSPAQIAEIVEGIAGAGLRAGVSLTVPCAAQEPQIVEAMAGLFERSPAVRDSVAVRCDFMDGAFGREDARHRVQVVGASADCAGGFDSMIAPGQEVTSLRLPERPELGDANVHVSGTSTREIVEAVRAATRFVVDHPPLLGADRQPVSVDEMADRAPGSDRSPRGRAHRLADLFTGRWLEWGASSGLLLDDEGSACAAANYVRTAFFMHHRLTNLPRDWEQGAELSTRCMLAIAMGDDGVFDGVFAGETAEVWQHRMEASARFLQAVAAGDTDSAPPAVNGAARLQAIATAWRDILARHAHVSHPQVLAGFRKSLHGLYEGSLAEYARDLTGNPLASRFASGGEERRIAARSIEERYVARAPESVGARISSLLATPAEDAARLVQAEGELRLLLYLHDMAESIGAGLLFRTTALRIPAETVTSEMAAALDGVTTLMDYGFRLANDVSSFLGWPEGERDGKQGACAALIPAELEGVPRAQATSRALATCRAVGRWIEQRLAEDLQALDDVWPEMGSVVRRGVFVGKRVYEVGHYATLSREQMLAILDELEAREAPPSFRRAG